MRLLCGDCRVLMAGLDEASVDAIVTDPPYGLEFMGKEWDHGVPGVPFWTEAWRVAKPGAHLLAFGGTRTFHRLTCAIEDAGWEIRDCIAWIYGQGFPKSKSLRDIGRPELGTALKPSHEPVVWAQKPYTPFQHCAIMIRSLSERIESWAQGHATDSRADTSALTSAVESTALNTLLLWRSILAGCFDGGRTSTTSTDAETTIDWKTLNFCLSQVTPADITGDVSPLSGLTADASNAARYFSATLARLSATRELSVLAPAIAEAHTRSLDVDATIRFTPIIVARKPLMGTVSQNVQRFGTGAINVDGCRVPTEDKLGGGAESAENAGKIHEGWQRPWMSDPVAAEAHAKRIREHVARSEALGRWPANLIHDGSAEVLAGFPQNAGACAPASGRTLREGNDSVARGHFNGLRGDPAFHADSGSAARFFYCAKASRAERGDGNTHPTVKPLELMRYLVRLVTPPGGLVLDPFMGSGTTGMACQAEGFEFLGMDTNPEYVVIAERRIVAAEPTHAETPLLEAMA